MIKFVPTPMQKVAKKAIAILKEYTDAPRELAKFIIKNPGVLPNMDQCPELEASRKNGQISTAQIKRLFGIDPDKKLWDPHLRRKYSATRATRRQEGLRAARVDWYDFKTFEQDWWADFKSGFESWPYVVKTSDRQLKADDALMLCFRGELDPRSVNKSKIFLQVPGDAALAAALSSNLGGQTIFEALNIRLRDGSYPSIRSHTLRHFLNTMAQRASIPEPLIAAWSGRRLMAQNANYDHRTDRERLEAMDPDGDLMTGEDLANYVKQVAADADYDEFVANALLEQQVSIFKGEVAAPSADVLSMEQRDFNEIRKKMFISVTDFGFCLGNLREDPCPSAQNCICCARHMVCKAGDNSKKLHEKRLSLMLNQLEVMKQKLVEEDPRVTPELISHFENQCKGAQKVLLARNDPGTEPGSFILSNDFECAQQTGFRERAAAFADEKIELQKNRKEITDDQTDDE